MVGVARGLRPAARGTAAPLLCHAARGARGAATGPRRRGSGRGCAGRAKRLPPAPLPTSPRLTAGPLEPSVAAAHGHDHVARRVILHNRHDRVAPPAGLLDRIDAADDRAVRGIKQPPPRVVDAAAARRRAPREGRVRRRRRLGCVLRRVVAAAATGAGAGGYEGPALGDEDGVEVAAEGLAAGPERLAATREGKGRGRAVGMLDCRKLLVVSYLARACFAQRGSHGGVACPSEGVACSSEGVDRRSPRSCARPTPAGPPASRTRRAPHAMGRLPAPLGAAATHMLRIVCHSQL